jgi:hypothetical protein
MKEKNNKGKQGLKERDDNDKKNRRKWINKRGLISERTYKYACRKGFPFPIYLLPVLRSHSCPHALGRGRASRESACA